MSTEPEPIDHEEGPANQCPRCIWLKKQGNLNVVDPRRHHGATWQQVERIAVALERIAEDLSEINERQAEGS